MLDDKKNRTGKHLSDSFYINPMNKVCDIRNEV